MSINSSLVKLADKIDADGKSSVSPEYKNSNNSIEKSLQRIADTFDATHKSIVTPEYRNPNNSIERSLERIADTYTSGGSGGGDDTFDVLFEIDTETPSARLVKGHFSDLDLTTPNVKVGAYYKPFGSQMPNIVFSVSAMVEDVDSHSAGFAISAMVQEGESFYYLLFRNDDTVEIEEVPNPFPPSQITLQRGYGSSVFYADICGYEHHAFVCGRALFSGDGYRTTIAPLSTHFYDADGEIINNEITFDPADAGSYNEGQWVITKSCSITHTSTK